MTAAATSEIVAWHLYKRLPVTQVWWKRTIFRSLTGICSFVKCSMSQWLIKKKTLSWRMQVWHSREFLFSVSNQFSSNCYFQTWQQRRILYSCIYPGFSFNFWFGTGRKTSSILLGWIFMNTKFERELLKIRDHLRFLVNPNQSSRYKTTTIPHFANIKPWQVTKFYCGDMTGQPSGACQK